MKKVAATNYGNALHLLDHIAPIAYILDIPLFVDDERNYELLKKYYPQTKSHLKEPLTLAFLSKNFDALVSCNYWYPEDKLAFINFNNKDMKLVFCPHGNSDKGYINKVNMQSFAMQDSVMLYGNHMIDLLKNLAVYEQLKEHSIIGNLRLSFYKKHKTFYDEIIKDEILSSLNSQNKTILYAPTWKDIENSSSFFEIFSKIIKNVPSHYNLIIKLHPSIEDRNPTEFYQLYEENLPSNIKILQEFPLIYPLLNKIDMYIGDFSSVGYDFLYFNKPMFFIDHQNRNSANDPSLSLYKCGIQIDKKYWNDIFSFIDNNLSTKFSQIQAKTYRYAFGKEKELSEIKKIISPIL